MFLPLVIAHRGASGYVLENTLLSFETAAKIQADMIELDVQITSDMHLVVFHDDDLSRLAGISSYISEMTLKEINNIELREGKKIPLLSDVLDAMKGRVGVNIEIKLPFIEKQIINIVKEKNMLNEVMFSSFIHGSLLQIKELDSQITTAILYKDPIDNPIDYAKEMRVNAVNPYFPLVNHLLIDDAHANGIKVFPWTVNERRIMTELLDLGVDGIITDFPDICGEAVMEHYHSTL